MARRLVLISTSTVFGTRYLEHAYPELREAFGSVARVLFIPHALKGRDAYAAKARVAFAEMGYGLDSLHESSDPREAIERAEAIFCGGGNTFRLLKALHEMGVLPLIERRVRDGMVYAGASAGSNLACPTIRTTNDMPIVEPPSFDGLGLVRFQINPHYLDPAPGSTHMGETRETRIREFHEENETPVAGLREGAILRVEGASVALRGVAGARIFRRGLEPLEFLPGAALEGHLEPGQQPAS
ncbi:MAG TPA: dipeptidase PepE [Vicinamibacteria bacterium]|nr:dipeptidase PepE [Vicinamibacteria bacterium]